MQNRYQTIEFHIFVIQNETVLVSKTRSEPMVGAQPPWVKIQSFRSYLALASDNQFH